MEPVDVSPVGAGTVNEDSRASVAVDERAASSETAMLKDIDAILARLEVRIAKSNKAMDELLERLRRPAA